MNDSAVMTPMLIGPGLDPGAAEEAALHAFDQLSPGEHVRLVLTSPPAPLLARFRAVRPGEFDWTPTREGPETWQVEVSRRPAGRGALREINEALAWDHDRLDQLEIEAFAARQRGDLAGAVVFFSKFAFGLRRHIRFEEAVLFPEFESRVGFPVESGPTAAMRAEHREILEWIERIEAALPTDASIDSLRHGLHEVLGPHNLKEEKVVYPLTDAALTPIERDGLVARIQAV